VIPDSWQERLEAFVRSVIPADPAQLLFLVGIVCLIFAPRMSWWPSQLDTFLARLGITAQEARLDSAPILVLDEFAIIFSALAGLFVCFWPGPRGVRRVLLSVLLPSVAAICITFGRFAYLGRSYYSALDRSIFHNPVPFAEWRLWTSTPGFHVAFLGIVLIGIFTSRMIFGISSLPLALPKASVNEPSDPEFWRRIQILIWVLVGPLFILALPLGVVAGIILYSVPNGAAYIQSQLFARLGTFATSLIFLSLVWWIVQKAGREEIRSSIRLTRPKFLFLGAALSIGIGGLISSGQYLVDRSHWASTQFGNTIPPQLGSYFNLPDPWLLLMFFGAFFEEIVFRGLLQSTFIRRYGLYRGIFLTGIVWAAYHFNSDAYTHPTELGVLSKLGFRLALCLALGFVLSWLTLRSATVLPAAVAHTFYNVLVSDFGPSFPGKAMVWVGLWALLAYFLFRYWPVQCPDEVTVQLPAAEPGIAI
jgi:membrane protease YdiL (CAAX protease family)